MLKAAVVAVPGALSGAGYYLGPSGYELLANPMFPPEARIVEVGVAFPEQAVRDVLPKGLRPADRFTGGIAIHIGEPSIAHSPFSTGYVWVDAILVETPDAPPLRYLLKSAVSENLHDASTIPQDVANLGSTYEWEKDGVLRATAWPDRATSLEVVVRTASEDCTVISAPRRGYLVSPDAASSAALFVSSVLEWCEAEAVTATIMASRGEPLNLFTPEQVLWAAATKVAE